MTLQAALEGNYKLSKEISTAVTLSERPPSHYKINQLRHHRDRVWNGLDPMFDYYSAAGYFFRYPKTRAEIDEHEEFVVFWNK